jgi:death-on-curing protein
MTPFIWMTLGRVKALHGSMIERFGGGEGIRDEGLLLSALANPENLYHYEGATVFECATAYAQAIAQNHAFVDGNKRTGFIVAVVFLSINGYKLSPQKDLNHENMMVNLAEKKITAKQFTKHIKKHSQPIESH